ncbi:MAG: hypothetical protein U9N45_04980 [Gemmatimonadota bacterium]|nr:hypothetical protein [Gemmatimonadota bacterium]
MITLPERQKIYILAASFGACSLVVQTEFLRQVMASAAGGTLAVGAALCAWLCWIALGAWAGGFVCSVSRDLRKALFFICALALPAALFPVFCFAGLRLMLDIPAGELVTMDTLGAWSGLASCPLAFFVGLSFPVFAGIASREQTACRSRAAVFIGGLWAAEAAGAFISGLIFTFILAGRTSPVLNTAVFGSLPLILSACLGLYPGKTGKYLSSALILACLTAFFFLPRLETKASSLYWEGLGSPGTLLSSRWTRYSHLIFSALSGETTLFENGLPVATFPDPYADASSAALLLSQHPGLSRVLVAGPSAYGLAQSLLAAGLREVTSVYPDREAHSELMRHLPGSLAGPLFERAGYRYICGDIRTFLGRQPALPSAAVPAGWDMVVLNLDGPSQANSSRYYTPNFFRRVRRAFGPAGGVLALRLPFGANVTAPAALDQAAAVWASLKAAFPHLALGLSPTHCFIFAADRDSLLSRNTATLMARVLPFEGQVPMLTRFLIPVYFDSTRVSPLYAALDQRSGSLRAHTDSSPVAWLHHLRLRARIARQSHHPQSSPGLLEKALDSAAGKGPPGLAFWPAILLSLAFTIIWLAGSRAGKYFPAVRLASALSIAAAGFTAMGATVTLIYLCQLVFGALFYQIALITSTFMLSLALGSFWASRRAFAGASSSAAVSLIAFFISVAVCLPSSGPFILEPLYCLGCFPGTALAMAVFYLLVAFVGLSCGMLLPWAAAIHEWASDVGRPTERTAAVLDFADHLGGAAGALAVGVFAVPALGLVTVGSSLALAMICVAMFWFAVSRKIS